MGKNHIRPRKFANSEEMALDFLEEPSINKVGMKSDQNSPQIMSEVNKSLKKGIVTSTAHEEEEFISLIFFRSKPDGTNRVILNLENLNQTSE